MKKLLCSLLLAITFFCGFSQSDFNDLIVTIEGDSIHCKIGLINDNSIFYQYQKKRKMTEGGSISQSEVDFYIKDAERVEGSAIKSDFSSASIEVAKDEMSNATQEVNIDKKREKGGSYLISAGKNFNNSLKYQLIGTTVFSFTGGVIAIVANPLAGLVVGSVGVIWSSVSAIIYSVKGNKDLIKAGEEMNKEQVK